MKSQKRRDWMWRRTERREKDERTELWGLLHEGPKASAPAVVPTSSVWKAPTAFKVHTVPDTGEHTGVQTVTYPPGEEMVLYSPSTMKLDIPAMFKLLALANNNHPWQAHPAALCSEMLSMESSSRLLRMYIFIIESFEPLRPCAFLS